MVAAIRCNIGALAVCLLALTMSASASPVLSQATTLADARHVQSFLNRVQGLCVAAPAKTCIDAGWKFAVASPDRGLTVADLKRLRHRLGSWYELHRKELRAHERASLGLGLLLADRLGAGTLHESFDVDKNGAVTQQELLADVSLDKRPLGAVLSDPASVDRAALARRLKLPSVLVNSLFNN